MPSQPVVIVCGPFRLSIQTEEGDYSPSLSLRIAGLGHVEMQDGEGDVLYLERRNGAYHVDICPDIHDPEPVSVSLEGAQERLRRESWGRYRPEPLEESTT